MGKLIGLKNMLIFSAVLLTIGSVSAQLASAGFAGCSSIGDGDWSIAANWSNCGGSTPDSGDQVIISNENIVITGDEQVGSLNIGSSGTLFIDCDASLLVGEGGGSAFGNITNHGTFTASSDFFLLPVSNFFNSGTFSGVVEDGGSIVPISTKCSQPIGGTVGSMSTTSLLVAGAQANMGWWIIALVGAVAVVGIAYKAKSNKTNKETL